LERPVEGVTVRVGDFDAASGITLLDAAETTPAPFLLNATTVK
jgi:hypothetical protein